MPISRLFSPQGLSKSADVSKEVIVVENIRVSLESQASTPGLQPTVDSPIPNGGWKAWLQVIGAHLLFFNSWGIVNSFGAYQAYYEADLLKSRSSSDISWIGTFQGFILIIFSIVSGPLFDQGYHRALLISGTFLIVFGMMMTSLATQYWELFLAQGIVVGLGAGCIFLPSVAIVTSYFSTKRALATGIVASGGSVGSVIYPIVFRKLQPKIGFPWATRVLAFIALATLSTGTIIMRTRVPHSKKTRALIDTAAFKSPAFILFCFGLFISFIGLYIPFFYIIIYAETSIKLDGDLSFYLLAVVNGASVLGRIIPGLFADKFGPTNVLAICGLTSSLLSYVWISIHDLGGIVVFCIFYGFFSGAVVSLTVTTISALVPELQLMGTWMGMAYGFGGLGFLIGNPIAGCIINVEENNFDGGFIFAASTVLVGSVAFVGVCILKFKTEKSWNV